MEQGVKFGERRSEFTIIQAILRLAGEGEGRTRIMYGANLNNAMLRRYLDGLEKGGFITHDGDAYHLTPSGATLKRDIERVLLQLRGGPPQESLAYDAKSLRPTPV